MAPVAISIAAGSSINALQPVEANKDAHPIEIDSDLFQGRLVVRIKNYKRPSDGEIETETETGFFSKYPDMHWSIEVQGRFKDGGHTLDDIMFGVAFDTPVRDHLPMLTPLALKLVHLVDPTIEEELESDEPDAMAPMCANMNRLAFVPLDANVQQLPQWEPDCQEDVTPLYHGDASKARLKGDYHARRKMYFKKSERQQAWPSNVAFQGNFVNPYLQFDNGVHLKLPKSFSLNLLERWQKAGQIPVYFVCRNRAQDKEYFAIRFQIAENNAK